jgi:hypothetical protein
MFVSSPRDRLAHLDAEEFRRGVRKVKNYTVWVSPPLKEHTMYMLSIHPSSPANVGTRVGGVLRNEETLRGDLSKNFPSELNSDEKISMIINGAKTGSYNLMNAGPIPLTDEAARNLGWIE